MPAHPFLPLIILETCDLMHVFAGVVAILLLTRFYEGQKRCRQKPQSIARGDGTQHTAPGMLRVALCCLIEQKFQQTRYFHNPPAVWPVNLEGMLSWRYQAKALTDRRLRAILTITPRKR